MTVGDEFIAMGAGYGGLTAAALLLKHGYNVTLLESHSTLGGCAGYFKRKDFLFDVGATTLSGFNVGQPLYNIFHELDISPKVKQVDPGLIVKIDDLTITRHADREKWIAYAAEVFNDKQQIPFWNELYTLADKAYKIIRKDNRIPPTSLGDYLSLISIENLKATPLLFAVITSFTSFMKKHKVDKNDVFRRFIENQLFITAQNTAKDTPLLTAAMGLTYPSETFYPYGGMSAPALDLANYIKNHGGKIHTKQEVAGITATNNGYEVTTKRGSVFAGKGIVSNIPTWNMKTLTNGAVKKYFDSIKPEKVEPWGAFTLNFAIEDFEDLPTTYFQIHTPSIAPHCNSQAFFVSFSMSDDQLKAPIGWRTVTISLHTRPSYWNVDDNTYNEMKNETIQFIMNAFYNAFPKAFGKEILYLMAGTPKTFQFYTKRHNGLVGGIPHSIRSPLIFMTPNATPFRNLYLVGDSVFPGQGTVSVAMGAANAVQHLLRTNK